jgi:hypothetical protein
VNDPRTRLRLATRHAPWAPWAGLIAGAAAWAVHHQAGSDLVLWDCRYGGPALTLGLGAVCALLALAGMWISWRSVAETDATRPVTPAKRFLGLLCTAAAALFLLTILAQSVSGLVLPGCLR